LKGRTVAIVIAPVVISMAVAGQRLSTPGPGLLIDAPLSQQEVLIGSFGRLGLQPFPENLVRPARAFAILLGRQAGTTHLLLLSGQEAGVAYQTTDLPEQCSLGDPNEATVPRVQDPSRGIFD
jgi:hypothetical protein